MTLLRTTRRANDVLSTRTREIRPLGTTTMQIKLPRKRTKSNEVVKNKHSDKRVAK